MLLNEHVPNATSVALSKSGTWEILLFSFITHKKGLLNPHQKNAPITLNPAGYN